MWTRRGGHVYRSKRFCLIWIFFPNSVTCTCRNWIDLQQFPTGLTRIGTCKTSFTNSIVWASTTKIFPDERSDRESTVDPWTQRPHKDNKKLLIRTEWHGSDTFVTPSTTREGKEDPLTLKLCTINFTRIHCVIFGTHGWEITRRDPSS